jgi:ATP/maltotriose-dependent transcriptional regulator MalT
VVHALANPVRQVRGIVDVFVGLLEQAPIKSVVIDDYHLLGTDTVAEIFVGELFRHLEVQLMVASRARPSWATARAAIYGNMLEIGSDELALTVDESLDVLGNAASSLRKELVSRANGWPVVIGLAALAKSNRRTPHVAVSSTLFRFFAEELFSATSASFQKDLFGMALLPALTHGLMETKFGERTALLLTEATAKGFVSTNRQGQPELHPLIREYLFSEIVEQDDADALVGDAIALSLKLGAWDNAFTLIQRFERVDLVDAFLELGFMPLVRSGRVETLEQVATWARSRSAGFSPAIRLIDAELALRDGSFQRASALARASARLLGPGHVLAARAHWVAGQAAQLCADFAVAAENFRAARTVANGDADIREALWGLMGLIIISEEENAAEVATELFDRRDSSPTDLLLATNAALLLRRYGIDRPFEVESALSNMDSVSDPRVRTSFMYLLSYDAFLRADYERARTVAQLALEQSTKYQLSWAIPHAEWVLAAACLGLREFVRADRALRRVETAAAALNEPHIMFNAAALRGRFLLALNQAEQARRVLALDDGRAVNPAMRAELIAMRALALAVLGENAEAEFTARQASQLTRSIEVGAHVSCVQAICRSDDQSSAAIFALSEHLDLWDPLVCAIRAHPTLLHVLSAEPKRVGQLQTLLRRSNDFDLAKRAAIPIGRRPRTRQGILSPREHEILQLVGQGLTDRQIGKLLFISPGTAKAHVQHILEKLDAHTRAEAAAKYSFERE